MKKLISDNNKALVNLLLPSLLNPSNELYIGSLTVQQLEELMNTAVDRDDWIAVVWQVFSYAQALYLDME